MDLHYTVDKITGCSCSGEKCHKIQFDLDLFVCSFHAENITLTDSIHNISPRVFMLGKKQREERNYFFISAPKTEETILDVF